MATRSTRRPVDAVSRHWHRSDYLFKLDDASTQALLAYFA